MAQQIRTWLADFKDKPLKDKIIMVLPYAFCIFFVARVAELYRLCGGNIGMFFRHFEYIYRVFPPHFALQDLLIGISIGFFAVYAAKWQNRMHKKNTRFGQEYGSSR